MGRARALRALAGLARHHERHHGPAVPPDPAGSAARVTEDGEARVIEAGA